MQLTFDTYEEYKKVTMDGSGCPSDFGFMDCDVSLCRAHSESCISCWMNSGADIVIKENPTKKITLEFDLPMCPYWDPITKTARHTCNGCHCESEGNTVVNAEYAVMANGDRYCCLGDDIKIRAGIVEAVKEK
jgi:hypothetical protein